jgi:hypothetical protein
VLIEMDAAYLPGTPPVCLRPGETIHCPFRIAGLIAIIPHPHDKSLLVRSSVYAYEKVRLLVSCLDSPLDPLSRHSHNGIEPAMNEATVRRDMLSQSELNHEPDPGEAKLGEKPNLHFLTLRLKYITPSLILDTLRCAYIPDNGAIVLKPGEVAMSTFPLEGVQAIFPNQPDNSLLVLAQPGRVGALRDMVKILDVPAAVTKDHTIAKRS